MYSRRTFITTAAYTVAAASLSSGVGAQGADATPPIVDTSQPVEIADGVWVIRDQRIWLVPNIGIVVGRDAVLVIDSGLGPANGERVFALARRLAGSKKIFLTLTHFHPEHGYGAQVFRRDATIIYNRAQRDELAQKGVRYIELFRQTQSRAAGEALQGTEIVMPHFVYDGASAEIDLGSRKVELHAVGLAHTRGDQVVFLPEEKFLFAGDLIEERMFPIFPYFPPADVELDGNRWIRVLGGFSQFAPNLIIPGHGDPGNLTIATELQAQMEFVKRGVTALRTAGVSPDQIVAKYKPKVVSAYPDWQHPEILDLQLRYLASIA